MESRREGKQIGSGEHCHWLITDGRDVHDFEWERRENELALTPATASATDLVAAVLPSFTTLPIRDDVENERE